MTASSLHAQLLFDFQNKETLQKWTVVDDVVMGGKSGGKMSLNAQQQGIFNGEVSLENNGGFSSVRHAFESKDIENFKKIILKVKGDGKQYQFRMKHKSSDYHSYVTTFATKKQWETIEIVIENLVPTFRGRKVDLPNFNHKTFEQIGFLIANKRNEKFQLIIESIEFN